MTTKIDSSIPDSLRNWQLLPDDAQVRQPTVEALFGISSATLWRRVQSGALPKPRKFSARITTWSVGSLRAVLNAGAKV